MSTGQLHAAGLGRGAINLRVRRQRLLRVHRGVYAVGHRRLTFRGRLWAAVLACGGVEAAVLSHRTAAAVWGLSPRPSGKLELTTVQRSASTAALRVHRSRTLDPLDDVVRQPDGLPVTTVARTLMDLAEVLSHSLVARFDLPRPRVNAIVAGYEVDFLWPATRLIAETDGAAAHLTAAAFERDRQRDAALQVAGFRVVRFTWRQVSRDPQEVAATLSALLRR